MLLRFFQVGMIKGPADFVCCGPRNAARRVGISLLLLSMPCDAKIDNGDSLQMSRLGGCMPVLSRVDDGRT